jgi:hypothetical protein
VTSSWDRLATNIYSFICALNMSSFVPSPITPEDLPRLAVIQKTGFAGDVLSLGPLANVSTEDYLRWAENDIGTPGAGPGHRMEMVCAREPQTGKIAGWARWIIPLGEGEAWTPGAEKVPLPKGADAAGFQAMFGGGSANMKRIFGDRKRWCMFVHVFSVLKS